jgi:hypothetical protein
VSITVPSENVVVASGELLNPQEVLTADQLKRYNEAKGSEKTVVIKTKEEVGNAAATVKKPSLTWKYRSPSARDFAWACSRSFIWDGFKDQPASGKNAFAQSVYPVESAGAKAWSRSSEFVKTSIENYSKALVRVSYPSAVKLPPM